MLNKNIYCLIIILLLQKTLCECILSNISQNNSYLLTINQALKCNDNISFECKHLFVDTCPYAFAWMGNPGNSCDGICCNTNSDNKHEVKFICKCTKGDNFFLNKTMIIDVKKCNPDPKVSIDTIIIFTLLLLIFSSTILFILIIAIVTLCKNNYNKHTPLIPFFGINRSNYYDI